MGLADIVAVLRADTTEFNAKLDEASAKVAAFSTEGSSKMSSLSSALGSVPVPVVAIGAAAVVAAAAAFELGSKFDETTASIAASAGISSKAAASIGNAFLSTNGDVTFTGQQMGQAFADVAGQVKTLNGGVLDSSAAMAVMSASMDLAEASTTPLGNATSDVAKTLQQFGLGISSSPLVANVLFNAARDTGTSVDDLTTQLDKARSTMGAAAPPIGQLGGLLLDLTQHGETGRQAMATLNTAFAGIISPTAAVIAAQQALGVSFLDSKGNLDPLDQIIGQVAPKIAGMGDAQAIATLKSLGFGSASAKLLDTIRAGPAAYDADVASVTKSGSAHDAAAKQSDTFEGSLRKIDVAIQNVATKIGVAMQPAMKSLAKEMTKLSQAIIKDWPEISAAIKTAIDIVKPFLEALITKIKGVIEVFQGIIEFLKGVFTGNWSEAWEGIKKVLGGAFDAIIGSVLKLFAPFTGAFKKIWSTVSNDIHSAWSDIINFFTGIPATLAHVWSDIVSAIETAWSVISGWVNTNVIQPVVKFFESIVGLVAHVWSDVVTALETVWNAISGWVNTNVIQPVVKFFESITGAIAHVWTDVTTAISTAWNTISGWVNTNVIQPVVKFFESIPGAIAHVWSDVVTAITGAWNTISGWVSDNVVTPVVNFFESIPGAIAHVWSDVVTALQNAWNTVSSWVDTNVIQPVEKFFTDMPGNILNALSGLAAIIEKPFQDAYGFIQHVVSDIEGWLGDIGIHIGNTASAAQNLASTMSAIPNAPDAPAPHHALGTGMGTFQGLSWVGEQGPELVNFGSPVQILPNAVARSVGGGSVVYLTSSPTFTLQGTPESMLAQMQALIDQENQKLIRQLEVAR